MQYYTFPISVQAYSETEAKAKLNLLLALGSFFVDFKIDQVAGAFMNVKLMEVFGKAMNKQSDEAVQTNAENEKYEKLRRKLRKKRVLKEASEKEQMAKKDVS